MKPVTVTFAALCAAALLPTPVSGSSSAEQTGVVIVDVKAVATDIANNINVQASLIPLTVQAPIDVAAKVCGVPETVLRAEGGSQGERAGVSCAATTTSPALEQLVRTKVGQQ